MTKKKFYIPTSIVYTNRSPHIGFALEIVQADVLARYHRLLGEKVFFSTGTDQHGTKNVQAAEEVGKTPEVFTEEITQEVKKLIQALNLSNDDFIQTTDKKRHYPAVEKAWLKLKGRGEIYKKKYKGLYCVGCEAFVKEKDLIDEKCPLHERIPKIVEEENYFFRLSKYQDQLEKIIRAGEIKITPMARKKELLSFITQGLEDVSCSRPKEKLEWGIPVPGDSTQIIYVWLEALVNYLSVLDYAKNGNKFKKFWPPDVHCIGKDIFVRFHGSFWPAIVLSLGLELPRAIFVHGFITSGGKKISKTLGNTVDPFELVRKYGTDAVRYFLLREILSTEDGDFTYKKFEQRYNSDLASGLGNLTARVITLAKRSKIKYPAPRSGAPAPTRRRGERLAPRSGAAKFQAVINETHKNCRRALKDFKFNEALISIWGLIGFCDRYIEQQKPWESIKSKVPKGRQVSYGAGKSQKPEVIITNLLFSLEKIAELLEPFMPQTSEKILEQIKTQKSKPLFPKLK